jgi:hypothetical protein
MTVEVTEAQMLRLGLSFIGVDEERTNRAHDNSNRDRFTKSYGVSPLICTIIFGDLQVLDIGDKKISKPKPKHFLLCMFWLKRYQVESLLSTIFGFHEETVRKWLWTYAKAIQALKQYMVSTCYEWFILDTICCLKAFYFFTKQIVWHGVPNDDNQQVGVNDTSFLLSVDGTHCRVQEPHSRPNKNWFSHKHHKPCVAYEIGVHLFESRIVWVNGSFEATLI